MPVPVAIIENLYGPADSIGDIIFRAEAGRKELAVVKDGLCGNAETFLLRFFRQIKNDFFAAVLRT